MSDLWALFRRGSVLVVLSLVGGGSGRVVRAADPVTRAIDRGIDYLLGEAENRPDRVVSTTSSPGSPRTSITA